MSKKQLRKLHIDGRDYIYTVKKDYPGGTYVNVWKDGDKSKPLYQFEFEEYVQVTPSLIKERIQTEFRNEWYNKKT